MEKQNIIIVVIVAIMAVMVFTGCDTKEEASQKVSESKTQKRHTIRVVLPEELKDQVQFELHIQPASQAITVKEASAVTAAPAVQHKEPEAPKAESTTPVAPATGVERTVTNNEPGWFDRTWHDVKVWWNA